MLDKHPFSGVCLCVRVHTELLLKNKQTKKTYLNDFVLNRHFSTTICVMPGLNAINSYM